MEEDPLRSESDCGITTSRTVKYKWRIEACVQWRIIRIDCSHKIISVVKQSADNADIKKHRKKKLVKDAPTVYKKT